MFHARNQYLCSIRFNKRLLYCTRSRNLRYRELGKDATDTSEPRNVAGRSNRES
jgi:hypothetical protein